MQTVHPPPEAIRLAMARIERAIEVHGGGYRIVRRPRPIDLLSLQS